MQPTSKKYDSSNIYQDVDRFQYRQNYVMNVPGPMMNEVVYHQDPSMRPSGGWSQNGTVPLELDTLFRGYREKGVEKTDRLKTLADIQDSMGGKEAVTLIPTIRHQQSSSTVPKFQLHSYLSQPAFTLRGIENTRELDFPLRDPLANVFNPIQRDVNTVQAVKAAYQAKYKDPRSRGRAAVVPTFVQTKHWNPAERRRF
jgi:hypothetical protein